MTTQLIHCEIKWNCGLGSFEYALQCSVFIEFKKNMCHCHYSYKAEYKNIPMRKEIKIFNIPATNSDSELFISLVAHFHTLSRD